MLVCKKISPLLRIFLLFLCLFPIVVMSYPSISVWVVLSRQFSLDHEINRPEVQGQLRWLIQHPQYLQQLTRSEPYMYHIMTEIKKRHLPGELALLPMLESAYNPFAYSGAGAAGLWQLMPGTGSDLGLKQDWWFDARRSIPSSTGAALNYLEYLHRYFHGNWILAFAAYNAGEAAMSRIIKENHHTNFWALPVPKETKNYVPRLLALAEIIQHPEKYHVQLPPIAHVPYFEEVAVGSQIDLNHAAQLAGISYQDLLKLNPGYNRWATAPNQPYKLLIPASHVARFSHNLSQVPKNQRVSWTRYRVKAGDNLYSIAASHHTTVNMIKELNQLKSNAIPKGQFVLIPNNSYATQPHVSHSHFSKPNAFKTIYIVDKNDTLESIAQKSHITVAQIKFWNNGTEQTELQPGQSLILWRSTQSATYTVKNGDNLNRIALTYHTNLKKLYSLNPKLRTAQLRTGQIIRVS